MKFSDRRLPSAPLLLLISMTFVCSSATAQRSLYKYIYSVDYPVGQKDAYLEWVRSVAGNLQANEEVARILSYDNYFGSSPQRVIEFEFESMEAAARYFELPKVNSVLDEVVVRGVRGAMSVYKLRGDYTKGSEDVTAHYPIKYVISVDYPLGRKRAYLEWIETIADYLQVSEHVERIASYDNYFGASPHRRIEFEFETMSDAASYWSDPVIAGILADIVNHGVNSGSKVLTLRSDYTQK